MKNGITSKAKLWIIITVAILALGVLMVAIFGFNKTVDHKASYEVVVAVDDYKISNASKLQDTVENFFDKKDYKPAVDAEQVIESGVGFKLIYKFSNDIKLNVDELKAVVNAFYTTNDAVLVEVEYHNVSVSSKTQAGWVLLCLAIATLVSFLFVLIFEKGKGALTLILTSVLGTIVCFALTALVRVPVENYLGITLSLAFVLTAILSSVMINRFREEIRLNEVRNENSQKLTFNQIADKSACDSFLRFAFVFIALLIVSIVFVALGTMPLKFVGLNLLVANVTSSFIAYVGTPIIWSALKNTKGKKA